LYVECAFAAQQLVKALALNVFHYQEEDAFRALTEIGNVNNVGMTDRCGRSSLTLKSCDRFALNQVLIVKNVGPNSFDCDAPGDEILIAGQIDLAHRATP
jgi:hypothetical protein